MPSPINEKMLMTKSVNIITVVATNDNHRFRQKFVTPSLVMREMVMRFTADLPSDTSTVEGGVRGGNDVSSPKLERVFWRHVASEKGYVSIS